MRVAVNNEKTVQLVMPTLTELWGIFKCYLSGDTPVNGQRPWFSKRYEGITCSIKNAMLLVFYNKIPLHLKPRKIDLYKPFKPTNTKTLKIQYKIWIWNIVSGFTELKHIESRSPAEIITSLNLSPNYIIVMAIGEGKEHQWCNVSIEQITELKPVALDWHSKLINYGRA